MDITPLLDFRVFGKPLLPFLFDEHLGETIAVLGATACSLYAVVAKLHTIVRNRRALLSLREKLADAMEIYIPPHYGTEDPAHHPEPAMVRGRRANLITFFEKAFKPGFPESRFILLADAGMGKSALLLNLYGRYLRSIFTSYDVVLIELGAKDAISKIAEIKTPDNTVLLLDALDENSEAIDSYFDTLNKLLAWTHAFYRVVLTCRTQFFSKAAALPDLVANVGGTMAAGGATRGRFVRLYLYPLTSWQIQRFFFWRYIGTIRNFSPIQFVDAQRILTKVPNVAVRPMLLTYFDYLLAERFSYQYSYKIYEAMIYGWLKRRKSDALDPAFSTNLRFMYFLAVDMVRRYSERQGYYIPKGEAVQVSHETHADLLDWQISGRSLLNINADGQLKFAHTSFMEVLVSRAVLRRDDLAEWEQSTQVKEFVKEMVDDRRQGKNVIKPKPFFEADIEEEFRRLELPAAVSSQLGKATDADTPRLCKDVVAAKDFSFRQMEAFVFSQTNFARSSFRGSVLCGMEAVEIDFRGADFTGADLTRAKFVKCNLEGATLLGADITCAEFRHCNLVNSDFSCARIQRSKYGLVANPLFDDSNLCNAIVPNDYEGFFAGVAGVHLRRDFGDVDVA